MNHWKLQLIKLWCILLQRCIKHIKFLSQHWVEWITWSLPFVTTRVHAWANWIFVVVKFLGHLLWAFSCSSAASPLTWSLQYTRLMMSRYLMTLCLYGFASLFLCKRFWQQYLEHARLFDNRYEKSSKWTKTATWNHTIELNHVQNQKCFLHRFSKSQ
jgi:hypothetical protein